ncbi:predicted protein [Chaetoceros tenuissimus]|uniref:DNA endonuclease activator Ctp1 C-terminal domain-containing protein n=1 Tax=Chaetoceros tenuissimus TaxID=426638 RepID=A0AAD3H075_9STRA|nr:predicted protein [Chaetoceros tenuissimus]
MREKKKLAFVSALKKANNTKLKRNHSHSESSATSSAITDTTPRTTNTPANETGWIDARFGVRELKESKLKLVKKSSGRSHPPRAPDQMDIYSMLQTRTNNKSQSSTDSDTTRGERSSDRYDILTNPSQDLLKNEEENDMNTNDLAAKDDEVIDLIQNEQNGASEDIHGSVDRTDQDSKNDNQVQVCTTEKRVIPDNSTTETTSTQEVSAFTLQLDALISSHVKSRIKEIENKHQQEIENMKNAHETETRKLLKEKHERNNATNAEIENLVKRVHELEENNADLSQQLTSSHNQIKSLQRQTGSLQAALQKCKSDNKDLKRKQTTVEKLGIGFGPNGELMFSNIFATLLEKTSSPSESQNSSILESQKESQHFSLKCPEALLNLGHDDLLQKNGSDGASKEEDCNENQSCNMFEGSDTGKDCSDDSDLAVTSPIINLPQKTPSNSRSSKNDVDKSFSLSPKQLKFKRSEKAQLRNSSSSLATFSLDDKLVESSQETDDESTVLPNASSRRESKHESSPKQLHTRKVTPATNGGKKWQPEDEAIKQGHKIRDDVSYEQDITSKLTPTLQSKPFKSKKRPSPTEECTKKSKTKFSTSLISISNLDESQMYQVNKQVGNENKNSSNTEQLCLGKNTKDARKEASRTPTRKDEEFRFQEVIRGKKARAEMHGADCPCCGDFYKAVGEGKGKEVFDIEEMKQVFSRHRSKYQNEQATPDGYWDMSFADSVKARQQNESLLSQGMGLTQSPTKEHYRGSNETIHNQEIDDEKRNREENSLQDFPSQTGSFSQESERYEQSLAY